MFEDILKKLGLNVSIQDFTEVRNIQELAEKVATSYPTPGTIHEGCCIKLEGKELAIVLKIANVSAMGNRLYHILIVLGNGDIAEIVTNTLDTLYMPNIEIVACNPAMEGKG
jgi:hypothetical protein